MRKYKQVKRKEVVFSLDEWSIIENKAAAVSLKTGIYIKQAALNGKVTFYNATEVAPVMNALRIIGSNINQIAKKANEINSIHAGDIEKLQEEYNSVCHTLNQFLSTLQSTAA